MHQLLLRKEKITLRKKSRLFERNVRSCLSIARYVFFQNLDVSEFVPNSFISFGHPDLGIPTMNYFSTLKGVECLFVMLVYTCIYEG